MPIIFSSNIMLKNCDMTAQVVFLLYKTMSIILKITKNDCFRWPFWVWRWSLIPYIIYLSLFVMARPTFWAFIRPSTMILISYVLAGWGKIFKGRARVAKIVLKIWKKSYFLFDLFYTWEHIGSKEIRKKWHFEPP